MTRQGFTNMLLSIGLMLYLLIGLAIVRSEARQAPCDLVNVTFHEADGVKVLSEEDITTLLADSLNVSEETPFGKIDIQKVEDYLATLPSVENVNVNRTCDNRLDIKITPMLPIARVYVAGSDESFYINKEGKRLGAFTTSSRVDVPMVVTSSDTITGIERVKPIVDAINTKTEIRQLVSAISLNADGDIYIIPSIRGHIINFGNTDNVDDKFSRLLTFYRKVMPLKGWNYYDTLSVKYAGQVIATVVPEKRRKTVVGPDLDAEEVHFKPWEEDPDYVNDNKEIITTRL